jgi:uncharacterized membrane protein YkvI
VKRLWLAVVAGLAVSVAADFALGRDIPGFAAVFGLLGCVAIILGSKMLGELLLQRHEDYYDPGGED